MLCDSTEEEHSPQLPPRYPEHLRWIQRRGIFRFQVDLRPADLDAQADVPLQVEAGRIVGVEAVPVPDWEGRTCSEPVGECNEPPRDLGGGVLAIQGDAAVEGGGVGGKGDARAGARGKARGERLFVVLDEGEETTGCGAQREEGGDVDVAEDLEQEVGGKGVHGDGNGWLDGERGAHIYSTDNARDFKNSALRGGGQTCRIRKLLAFKIPPAKEYARF